MTVVIGTAGHIDHGKTALLRALTGIDADRLPEERRRGMTIDVGYAHLRLADGTELDFVDVPGHDRLVGNMLVGAGEIDAALLVVAADDGPRAQTVEHLELLDALGIRDGIVVLTKIDSVDPARAGEAGALVRTLLAGTTLEAAPILAVSSVAGTGLAELAEALVGLRDRVLASSPAGPPPAGAPVRLAIDRVFAVKGRGTVVTGSLRGGRLTRGAQLRLVPGDRPVRAREVQVHGRAVEAVEGGGRVALNLAGIDVDELERGGILSTDELIVASARIIAVLAPGRALRGDHGGRGWPPAPGASFRLHLGTDQVEATLGRGRRDRLVLPDGRVVARLRFGRPIGLAAGDRFVLRHGASDGPAIGGVVADPLPPTGPSRRRADPDRLAALASADPIERSRGLVALHGVLDPARLPRAEPGAHPGAGIDAGRLAGLLVQRPLVEGLQAAAVEVVAGHAREQPARPGMSRAELRAVIVRSLRRQATVDLHRAGLVADALLGGLVDAGRLVRSGDQLDEPGGEAGPPAAVTVAMGRLERLLATPAPPSLAGAARQVGCPLEGIRALESSGRIVRLDDDLAYAAATYGELARTALTMAAAGPLSPAAYRDATGTSRKYVLAILEDLDRRGILRRTLDGHLPGPRAALIAGIGRADP